MTLAQPAERRTTTAPRDAAPATATGAAQRFAALDAFRAIGATMVVVTHVAFLTGHTSRGQLSALLARLDVGVAVFFVLSGFLLFRPHVAAAAGLGSPQSTSRYLIRRAARILPAYWLLIVVSFLVLPENARASAADWARHATLTQIYESSPLRTGVSQTWSLCTEVAFYLALPVVAALLCRTRPGKAWRPGRLVLLLALAVPIGPVWSWVNDRSTRLDTFTAGLWLPAYAGWFAAGMALAVVSVAVADGRRGRWRTCADLGSAPMACWSIAAALLAIASTPVAGPPPLEGSPSLFETDVKSLLYGGFAIFLILPAVFPPREGRLSVRLLSSQLVGYFGRISYGIFLWHVVALHLLMRWLDVEPFTGRFPELFALTFLGACLAAAVSFHVLEEPIQRLSRRATRQRHTTPTAQSARQAREAA